MKDYSVTSKQIPSFFLTKGYTERYMDTPQNNPEGYEKGSILTMANGFPDE